VSAPAQRPEGRLQDLRAVAPEALAPLLAEEDAVLWDTLRWRTNQALGAAARGAGGVVWLDGDRPLGYLSLALDGAEALAGRVFASRGGPWQAVERTLLEAAIRGAFAVPGVQTFSGELLGLAPATLAWLKASWPDQVGLRLLLEAPAAATVQGSAGCAWVPWDEALRVPASGLLARNAAAPPSPFASYRAPEGPARLLEELVTRDTCGAFEPSASFAALDPATGDLLGFVLATRMGPDQGHVAQLAVAAETRRRGVGTGLLHRSLESLATLGCRSAHLTADQDNRGALALYRRSGFQERHVFPHLRLRS